MAKKKVDTSMELNLTPTPGISEEQATANAFLSPELANALNVKLYNKHDLGITEVFKTLTEQNKQLNEGSMTRAENMLMTQAHVLQSVFNDLLLRARVAEHMPQLQTYMTIALKA